MAKQARRQPKHEQVLSSLGASLIPWVGQVVSIQCSSFHRLELPGRFPVLPMPPCSVVNSLFQQDISRTSLHTKALTRATQNISMSKLLLTTTDMKLEAVAFVLSYNISILDNATTATYDQTLELPRNQEQCAEKG
eukprot:6070903-Amphidinium_carterae.2